MIEKADLVKEYQVKEAAVRKSTAKSSFLDCAMCKINDKARTDITLELSKAEKAVLEAKNEKMMCMLEMKNIEEKMRNRENEFSE